MRNFEIFSEPERAYSSMLRDIRNAKKYICLETYIYGNDEIGRKFRDALIKKAREGVKIFVLIDAWGTGVDKNFFSRLIKAGGEVRFFREFQYVMRILSKNHERNHRKLLLIDGEIVYLGSMNITAECLKWRELIMKLEGEIAETFYHSFFEVWNLHGKINKKRLKSFAHKSFEVLQDFPSKIQRPVEKRFKSLIRFSKKLILIETPYFLPSRKIRKEIVRAAERGVKIIIIIPKVSDVHLVDILRNRYFEKLYKKGVRIYLHNGKDGGTLHSKLLIVDSRVFILGSSNLDYRSFIHQYELNLMGRNRGIIKELKEHFKETLSQSEEFNYFKWKKRSSFGRMLEMILNWFREYL
jgi:cardiolipin synthase